MSTCPKRTPQRRARSWISPHRMNGFTLSTVTIFLLMAAMMAMISARVALVRNETSAANRAVTQSRLGADLALRRAEAWLFERYLESHGAALSVTADGSSGIWPSQMAHPITAVSEFKTPGVWNDNSPAATAVDSAAMAVGLGETRSIAAAPAYLIEDLGPARPEGASASATESGVTGGAGYYGSAGASPSGNHMLRVYRITAKSVGQTTSTVTTLESIYAGRTRN